MISLLRRRPRGYLLAEVGIAAAILSTAVAVVFATIAQQNAKIAYAAHRQSAVNLARAKADEIATRPDCTGGFAAVAVGAAFPGFTWEAAVRPAPSAALSVPPVTSIPLCEVEVVVRYPAERRSLEDRTDDVVDGRGRITLSRMWHR